MTHSYQNAQDPSLTVFVRHVCSLSFSLDLPFLKKKIKMEGTIKRGIIDGCLGLSIIPPQEMAEEFKEEAKRTGKERLLLTAAVAAGKENMDGAYEVKNISK